METPLYIFFAFFGCTPQLTRFFKPDIFQFFIMINFPLMKNKFTTIKLKPNVSIIVFEYSEQTE